MSSIFSKGMDNIFKGIRGQTTTNVKNTTTPGSGANAKNSAGSLSYLFPVGAAATNTSAVSSSSIGKIAGYLFSILIVVAVILLFIHYFITPIIKSRPGSPGYIYLGTDDGILYWNKGFNTKIANLSTPIAALYYGYTINVDLYIQNPDTFSTAPRILFTRGATYKEGSPKGATIASILQRYNIAVALQPDTNDLIVSALNKDNTQEDIVLSNVPIRKTFRLTIALMQKSMEVFINGRLVKTRAFRADLLDQKGDIEVSQQKEDLQVAKIRNLKIWQTLISTAEIRGATPPMPDDKEMDGLPLPSMSSCPPPITKPL